MNNQITETDRVLADMLTENTGSHMLDSGGAYGRNWERNQGLTAQAFMEAPEVQVSQWGISLDLFHYLRQRLEFMPDIQQVFDDFAELPENKDTHWYGLMGEWRELYPTDWLGGFNSYNGECLLSQTIQGEYFDYEGETYLMLQIHGGCDVRGGYTAPKIFREYSEPGYIMYDWDSYTIQSTDDRKGEPVCLDYRSGDICTADGTYIGGYGYRREGEDYDPLLDWLDTDKCEWDEETNSFFAPDGDGHIEFIAPYAC